MLSLSIYCFLTEDFGLYDDVVYLVLAAYAEIAEIEACDSKTIAHDDPDTTSWIQCVNHSVRRKYGVPSPEFSTSLLNLQSSQIAGDFRVACIALEK